MRFLASTVIFRAEAISIWPRHRCMRMPTARRIGSGQSRDLDGPLRLHRRTHPTHIRGAARLTFATSGQKCREKVIDSPCIAQPQGISFCRHVHATELNIYICAMPRRRTPRDVTKHCFAAFLASTAVFYAKAIVIDRRLRDEAAHGALASAHAPATQMLYPDGETPRGGVRLGTFIGQTLQAPKCACMRRLGAKRHLKAVAEAICIRPKPQVCFQAHMSQ